MQKAKFKKVWNSGDWQAVAVGRNKRKDGKRARRIARTRLKREAKKEIQDTLG